MRPKTLDGYIGQRHLVGQGAVLRRMIESGRIASFILWGPPGVGKTTLARIIARTMDLPFYTLSAVSSGVKEVREVIERAKKDQFFSRRPPLLFIDEIHRFSKSQQDSLLEAVEQGTVTLIGATTENPSFEIIRPLLSRCQVYTLQPLTDDDLLGLLERVLREDTLLSRLHIEVQETAALLRYAGGDARKFLNIIDLVCDEAVARLENEDDEEDPDKDDDEDKEDLFAQAYGPHDASNKDASKEGAAKDASYASNNDASKDNTEANQAKPDVIITDTLVTAKLQANPMAYDKGGEMHYDLVSAFIKSIRGSDPDAAVYYLARMVAGGEDPAFIARRLVISASEDIGLANPNALLLANATFDTVTKVGWPEARIALSELTIYLASSPKSNSAYRAINDALQLVEETGNLPVPLHLRNAPTRLMNQLGYGRGYKYAHDYPGHFVRQQFLPDALTERSIWHPQPNPAEDRLAAHLQELWGNRYQKETKNTE
jgi:putative ATPase